MNVSRHKASPTKGTHRLLRFVFITELLKLDYYAQTGSHVEILELARRVVAAVDPTLEIEFQSYHDAYDDDFEDVRSRVPVLEKLKRTIRYAPAYDLDRIIGELVDRG